MATFTNARDLANYQRKKAQAFRREQGQVTQQEADRLVKRMNTRVQGLLSGRLSTEQLTFMGHPYRRSRRRLTSNQRAFRQNTGLRARLLPINVQSGALKEGTHVYAVVRRFGSHQTIVLKLRSNVAYALYQLDPENKGTKYMKPRGFWKALQKSYVKYDAAQIRNARLKVKRAADKLLRSV